MSLRNLLRCIVYGTLIIISIPLACSMMPATPGTDKELEPYLKTFLEYCDLYKKDCRGHKDYAIRINDDLDYHPWLKKIFRMEGTVVGLCTRTANKIEVSKQKFDEGGSEVEMIFIHEMGHCLLNMDHVEEKDDAMNVMNPYTIGAFAYVVFYQELMNKFFECKTNCPVVKYDRSRYLRR